MTACGRRAQHEPKADKSPAKAARRDPVDIAARFVPSGTCHFNLSEVSMSSVSAGAGEDGPAAKPLASELHRRGF